MVNVTPCDGCAHSKVCGKKAIYEKFIHAVNDTSISPKDRTIWYAKDCDDVVIDLKCNHFMIGTRIK
ncbi:MAG: hypothetical protein IKH75_00905 [Ruminococcus sp.]|nr:hypothetical protein [Ruminococcus sp.]